MRYFKHVCIFALMIFVTAGLAVAMDAPATVPAAGSVHRAAIVGRPLVEVFAFTPIGDAAHQDWIGRGIQENLQTEVSRTGALLVVAPQTPPAGADLVATAKQNGADLAVIGSYQVVADQVRVNGNLIETTGNSTVGSFSATGPQQDLFKLEDALGEQMRRLLPLPAAPPQVAQANEPTAAAVAPQPPVVNYAQPDAITNNYYDTTPTATPYYYPDSFSPSYYGDDYPYDSGFYGSIDIAPVPFFYGGGWGGGYGNRGYGYGGGYRGGFHYNPGFHNPVYHSGGSFGGYHGGGGSHGGGGGFHGSGGGFHGGGGGFHGGGGGGRR
jgi:TolB-like protein